MEDEKKVMNWVRQYQLHTMWLVILICILTASWFNLYGLAWMLLCASLIVGVLILDETFTHRSKHKR
jgi:hypothetical protein